MMELCVVREVFGRKARSSEICPLHGSGVGFFMDDHVESVADSQVWGVAKRGKHLKVLAAKRVLEIQKESGVSFSPSEGGIIEKLVQLEDVAVKAKACREEARVI